jgi:hypothetical protein
MTAPSGPMNARRQFTTQCQREVATGCVVALPSRQSQPPVGHNTTRIELHELEADAAVLTGAQDVPWAVTDQVLSGVGSCLGDDCILERAVLGMCKWSPVFACTCGAPGLAKFGMPATASITSTQETGPQNSRHVGHDPSWRLGVRNAKFNWCSAH